MQRNLATKIRAKQESSLTAVRLKRDPPVLLLCQSDPIFSLIFSLLPCIISENDT